MALWRQRWALALQPLDLPPEAGTAEVDEVRVTQLQPGGAAMTRLEIKKSPTAKARVQVDPKDPKRLEIVVSSNIMAEAGQMAEPSTPPPPTSCMWKPAMKSSPW